MIVYYYLLIEDGDKIMKKCSKTRGYSCGNSCISVKFVCRVDGLRGQSVSISDKMASMVKAVAEQKPKFKIERGEFEPKRWGSQIESTIDGNKISSQIFNFENQVGFVVNGDTTDAGSKNMTKEQKRKAASIIKEDVLKLIAAQPDGKYLTALIETSDGKGKARQRIYRRMGMGQPDRFGKMVGKVVDGKLQPVEPNDPNITFSEEEQEKTLEELILEVL